MNDKTLVERLESFVRAVESGEIFFEDIPSDLLLRARKHFCTPTSEAQATRIEALEAALQEMMQAVCGETGFVNTIRLDTGREYPWPALDIAEERAKQALESQP